MLKNLHLQNPKKHISWEILDFYCKSKKPSKIGGKNTFGVCHLDDKNLKLKFHISQGCF